jgi:sugar transferase (PEP-CTERM/EpsH1 system associated)
MEASSALTTPVTPLRILILTPYLPYPPIWGSGTRVYQFLRLLSRRHRVSLLAYAAPDEEDKIPALEKVCSAVYTVTRIYETARARRFSQLSSVFLRSSHQRRRLHSRAMQDALDRLISREHFDIIQIESSQMAGFKFPSGAVLVVDEHNIEYEVLYRMYRSERSVIRRLHSWIEFTKFRREELNTWRRVSGCVITSPREATVIRGIVPRTPTISVANGVDVELFRPSADANAGDALVMTGLMSYRPNVDGAIYFVQEIFPQILASRPDTILYLVGAAATDEVMRLASSNVVVTGTVPDVRPYVHRSAVFVIPLRMGGGTRLKALEALSMEKAVVSTSLGCEGIDVKDGEHLLIADEPRAFADSVLRLLTDRELAMRLGRQGRRLVERQYRWETVVAQLEEFYGRLLAASPPAAR